MTRSLTNPRRRTGAGALALTLAVTLLAACSTSDDAGPSPAPPATSGAPTDPASPPGEATDPADGTASSTADAPPDIPSLAGSPEDITALTALGGWLSGGLVDGNHATVTDADDYLDVGLTIDVGWALAVAGGHEAEVAAIGQWVADPAQIAAYTGAVDGELYVAAVAKTALALMSDDLAGTLDPDLRHAGLREQLDQLQGRVQADGRLTDDSPYGDYSGPYGQALAVIALVKDGFDVAAPSGAVEYLVGAGCPEGGWPMTFTSPSDLEEVGLECVTDIDTTAVALQALAVVGGQEPVLEKHLGWLLNLQQTDGSWGVEGPSVNTTGVVVSTLAALRTSGAVDGAKLDIARVDGAVSAGRTWLRGAQNTDGGLPIGATGESDMRAGAQAALGLAGIGMSGLVG
jgi:hypothetical protein